MKLINNIVNSFSLKRRNASSLSASAHTWLRGLDLETGSTKLTAPYSQCAWVYVAVSVLAESVAHVPFRISRGRGKGETLVDSGPVWELFNRPHPSMSRALFWQTLVSWEALRGEFFVVALDEAGQPTPLGRRAAIKQMAPLSPDHFAHVVENNQIAGWRCSCDKNAFPVASQVLLPEEVIHWRNFNPYDYWRGLSPLSVAMLPATSDYAAEQFMKGLMSNNGDAGMIVTTEEMLDQTQREQFMEALLDRKRRAGTADRPLFLWGKIKVETPSISSVDLQFLDNRKLNRQEIGAIFKVPESMMGFAGEKSALSAGAAIEQDRLTFIENTVGALCRRLEAAMEPLIKSMDPQLDGWFDLDALPIMQAARRERMNTAAKAFSMGVPFNELNQVYDLGFESLPWGNRGYVPETLRQVGVKCETNNDSASASSPENPTDKLIQLLESSKEFNMDSTASDCAKRKCGKLRLFFFEQRGRVLAALEARRNDENSDIAPNANSLFDVASETALLTARINPLLGEDYQSAIERLELDMVTDQIDVLVKNCEPALMRINEETLQRLNAALGANNCKDAASTIEAIKGVFQERAKESASVAMEITLNAFADFQTHLKPTQSSK
jgi:HK97 family phage portal protein